VNAGVSKLAKVAFARIPQPALLKEPVQFWNEIFIANEAYMLDEITHPRIRRKLLYDAPTHRLFLEFIEGPTLNELVAAGVTVREPERTHRLLQCVAETVADLHEGLLCDRPIVHNDLKSMNILVPTASPSGQECEQTRNRSPWRSALRIASTGLSASVVDEAAIPSGGRIGTALGLGSSMGGYSPGAC